MYQLQFLGDEVHKSCQNKYEFLENPSINPVPLGRDKDVNTWFYLIINQEGGGIKNMKSNRFL